MISVLENGMFSINLAIYLMSNVLAYNFVLLFYDHLYFLWYQL